MGSDRAFEAWKEQNAANLEHYRATWQYDLEQRRTVNLAGQSALKANVFLNAGAAVAILAFLANLFDKLDSAIAFKLIVSIGIFGTGALLGSVATGFTYLSQYSFDEKKDTLGSILNNTSNVLIVVSYNLFVVGAYATFLSIGQHFDLRPSTRCHLLMGIFLVMLNAPIVLAVWLVLKAKREEVEKEGT